MIPQQWFQPGEAVKMKQALGLWNKDSNASTEFWNNGDWKYNNRNINGIWKKYELNEG